VTGGGAASGGVTGGWAAHPTLGQAVASCEEQAVEPRRLWPRVDARDVAAQVEIESKIGKRFIIE